MWELDQKEGWAPKNWCFSSMVLEKTLESLLYCKEVKPVNPKRNKPCQLIGRTDSEAEAPILWPSDMKSWLIGKDPDAGKDWRQKEEGVTEDETVGCITDSMDISLNKLREMVKDRKDWCAAVHGLAKSWTHLRDWTTTIPIKLQLQRKEAWSRGMHLFCWGVGMGLKGPDLWWSLICPGLRP